MSTNSRSHKLGRINKRQILVILAFAAICAQIWWRMHQSTWNIVRQIQVHPIHENQVILKSLSFSTSRNQLAVAGNSIPPILVDTVQGSIIYEFDTKAEGDFNVAFSHNGNFLACAESAFGSGTLTLWNVPDRQKLWTIKREHIGGEIEFTLNDKFLVVPTDLGVTKINLSNGSIALAIHEYGEQIALSPSGNLLAIGIRPNNIQLYSFNRCNLLKRFSIANIVTSGVPDSLGDIAFSANSKMLAVGVGKSTARGDGKLIIWNVATSAIVKLIPEVSKIISISFSPDGKFIATAAENGRVTLRDTRTWSVKKIKKESSIGYSSYNDVMKIAFSHDSKHLIGVGKGQTIRFWLTY